jgi:hypothetical protein
MKAIGALLFLSGVFAGRASAKTFDVQVSSATGSQIRIRETPTLEGAILGIVKKGEQVLVVEKSTFSTHVDGGDYPWFQIVNATGTRGWTSARYMGPIKTADILDLAGSLFSRSLLEFAGDRPETPREILSFNVTDLDGDGIRDILANVTGVIGDGDGGIDPNKAHGSFVIINGGFAWMNNLSSYQWSVDPPSEFRDVVGDSRKELLSYARYGSGDGGETHYWVYGSQASSEAFHALADLVVGYASAGGIYNWRCVSDAPVWTKGESIVESRLSLTRHVELEVSRPRMFSISLKDVFQWTNSGLNRVGSSFVDGWSHSCNDLCVVEVIHERTKTSR